MDYKRLSKIELDYDSTIMLGDIHGTFEAISKFIIDNDITDTLLIQVGDFGVGFGDSENTLIRLNVLNKTLEERDCTVVAIRGNHDDPSWFNVVYNSDNDCRNILLVPDYTVLETRNRTFLLVGGAISIDRKMRMAYDKGSVYKTYWSDEAFIYNDTLLDEILKSDVNIDTVVTHSSSYYAYPYSDSILQEWYAQDSNLYDDIKAERNDLNKLYDKLSTKYNIKEWYYGHYHSSTTTLYNDTKFVLLDMYRRFGDNSKWSCMVY